MAITLISAVSENNVIGKDGDLPWGRILKDMKHFESLTLNNSVIMGRKTYLSIPEEYRPLHDRKNIVMSRDLKSSEDIYIARNMEEALHLANQGEVYIGGGEKIYEMFLPVADKIELTRIHGDFEGDAFFPKVDWSEWKEVKKSERFETKKGLGYTFETYERLNR
jgi:dihydrofolate reductase